jgi:type II secretory pathway pseudopilin PulG
VNQTNAKAFTLIETIAVIAAIAAVAAAVFLPMIRRLDELARQNEATVLANLANAYKQSAGMARVIPNETNWASAVAAVTGQQLNAITNNDRGLRRVFLIDSALRIGTNTSLATYSLPYRQSVIGHTYTNGVTVVRPVSPRLMLVSSCSMALPTNLVSGVAASSGVYAFNNLWGTANRSIPTGWTWTGRGDDLKIQRIDLSDLFIQIVLNNRDSAALPPSYSISTNTGLFVTNTVALGCRVPMYFLKGSEIRLYNVTGILEHSEILSQSKSFTFEKGTWEPEAYTASSVGQTSAIDLQKAMNLFMAAPTNTFADATQITVSNAMVTFLSEYMLWRSNSYALGAGNKPPKKLTDAQTALNDTTTAIVNLNP